MGIIKDLANSEGLALEFAKSAYDMYHELIEQGKNNHDIAAVLEIIEQRSNK